MPRQTIRQLDKFSRPREKLLRYGAERLELTELLAIMLRTGTTKHNAVELAREVLKQFPENSLLGATPKDLQRVSGIGVVKALELVASIALATRLSARSLRVPLLSAQSVWERTEEIRASKKEQFVVFYLDTQNVPLAKEVVSVGILNASLIHPREVFEPAIRYSAAKIIAVHNHPAGSLVPSEQDRAVTQRLAAVGELLGIALVDHVIVAVSGCYSFKEQGEL